MNYEDMTNIGVYWINEEQVILIMRLSLLN